ncbi:MAG: RNA polymerase sigma factor SigZ [Thermoanaerobaculia bacterium]|nr:RNA polymerase sigma factor SigZ [Thermoanaerobaculia bacterium]
MHETDRAARTEDVWRRFSTRLAGFLRSRLPDQALADDVLQEVFVKVHAGIHTLRDDERMQPWLYQIARNAIADHFRARPGIVPTDGIEAAAGVAVEEPAREAEQKLAASLLVFIDDLPERYREAIRLTEIDGLTQAELATRLGISLSGAKSRVQRGREKLKDLLLDCCHVEVDRNGSVTGYRERVCCDTCGPHDACGPKPRGRSSS